MWHYRFTLVCTRAVASLCYDHNNKSIVDVLNITVQRPKNPLGEAQRMENSPKNPLDEIKSVGRESRLPIQVLERLGEPTDGFLQGNGQRHVPATTDTRKRVKLQAMDPPGAEHPPLPGTQGLNPKAMS